MSPRCQTRTPRHVPLPLPLIADSHVIGCRPYRIARSSPDDRLSSNQEVSFGVGYQLTPNFAMELAYRDLGSARYETSNTVTFNHDGEIYVGVSDFRNEYESKVFILRGVGMLPVTEKLTLEALLGVAHVRTKYSSGEVNEGVEVDSLGGYGLLTYSDSYDEKETGWSATYGLGASYAFTPTIAGYARWERVHDINTESPGWGSIKADSVSAGLRYHF
ncbi:outer membrane beta-barrel protein [Halomonas sp. LBP4]|uniref:outer membrane beta-barrel protein n=1 Tax=Halomonas sp. LBP4 TaxID=2044917 RepID=UPI0021AC250C|nr:outer membrane beta-barrel protein [Halomonas sp. LBP4]